MNKIVLFFAFIVLSLQTYSQNEGNQPVEAMIAPNYSMWTYRSGYIHQVVGDQYLAVDDLDRADWEYVWFVFSGEFFYLDGETRTKNGKTYRVMKCNTYQFATGGDWMYSLRDDYIPYDIDAIPKKKNFEICIREEDGRVYVDLEDYLTLMADQYWRSKGRADYLPYEQTDDGELVLYDFNMQVGDKYPSVEGHEDIYVSRIDTVTTLDGCKRKQLELSNGLHIIEEIGCIDSSGEFLFYLNPAAIKQQVSILIHHGCGTDSGEGYQWVILVNNDTDFANRSLFKWPFDFSIVSSIQSPVIERTKDAQSGFYDLQGRRLTTQPTKGIYIQNGKKHVVK